jgi:O-antigen/teichoic acid export membrane protein
MTNFFFIPFFKYFEEIKNKYFQGHLTKGLFVIGSGIAVAQFIGIITTPIITRLYSPADFGVLAVFSSTLAIIVIAGGFRYDSALPLPKQDIDAANLFILFVFILSASTIVFIITIFLFGNFLFSLFRIENLKPYFFLFIIGFFGAGIYRALTYWVTRRRDYARITQTKITQSVGGVTSKILLGLLSFGPLGLIIGDILSQCLGITTLFKKMWSKDRHLFATISQERMIAVAKKYRHFPFFSFPAAIFNTFVISAPAILLSIIYGLDVTGYYGLAYSVVVLPSSLISQSLAQVYYAEASHMMRENSQELLVLFKSTTKKLLLIGIPLIGIPSVIAPFIFPIIFGGVWKEAGYFCLPLALAVLGGFVMSATSNLGGYGYNNWQMAWDFSRMLLVVGGFYLVALFSLPVMEALLIYSLVMMIMYYVSYLMNIVAIKRVRNEIV